MLFGINAMSGFQSLVIAPGALSQPVFAVGTGPFKGLTRHGKPLRRSPVMPLRRCGTRVDDPGEDAYNQPRARARFP